MFTMASQRSGNVIDVRFLIRTSRVYFTRSRKLNRHPKISLPPLFNRILRCLIDWDKKN